MVTPSKPEVLKILLHVPVVTTSVQSVRLARGGES
jgi:hypothetical protein